MKKMKVLNTLVFILILLVTPYANLFGQFTFGQNNVGVGGFAGTKENMESADFNGDGISDLVISNGTNQLAVIYINEDGGQMGSPYAPILLPAGASNMYGLIVADFDNDGDNDIAAAHSNSGLPSFGIRTFKNDGIGGFPGFTSFNVPTGGPLGTNTEGLRELVKIDFDKDGDIDLGSFVLTSSGVYAFVAFRNDGTGNFTPIRKPINALFSPAYDNTHKLSFAVFDNATGALDLLLVMNSNVLYRITDLASGGTLLFTTPYTGPAGEIVTDVASGDMDLDGDTDLIYSIKGTSNYVKISQNNGAGIFTDYFDTPFFGLDLSNVEIEDLDNDTDLDLIVSRRENTNTGIQVYENLIISGTPAPSLNLSLNIPLSFLIPTEIALGDFNVDGKTDFSVTISGGDQVFNYINTSAVVPITSDACLATNGAGFVNAPLLLSSASAFTVEGYFLADPTFTGHRQYLFYNGQPGTDGFGLYISDAGSGELFIEGIDNLGGTFDFSTGTNITSYNEWYHFAVVMDKSGNWNFYLNGFPRLNITTQAITVPKVSTLIGAGMVTVPPFNLGINFGNLQEFRFWNVPLDMKTIREWMQVQLTESHPFYFALESYLPLNENTGSIARDLAYTINPTAFYKEANLVFPVTWDNTDTAPIGDNGAGETENAAADINSRTKTGIEIDFQTPSGGSLIISRMFEEKETTFYPNSPTYIFSKVIWAFRQFGGSAVFADLDELIIDIKDDQFISGIYPVLNTPIFSSPAASAFKLFMRPIGSTDQSAWIQVGEGSGFGSLRARRPASTVSEFGRELVVGVDPSVLPVRMITFEGKRINKEVNILEWKTAFEYNNEVFEIEKSYDAKNFFVIGKIEGNEKSEKLKAYHFEDKYGVESAYYRINQKDKNGKRNYTQHIYIAAEDEKMQGFVIFPNPVSDRVQLRFPAIETEEFSLEIFNDLGVKVFDFKGNKLFLEESLQQNLIKMPSGLWIAKLSNGFKNYTTKWMKK